MQVTVGHAEGLKIDPCCAKRVKGRLYVSVPFLPDQNKLIMRDDPLSNLINAFSKHDVNDTSYVGTAQKNSAIVLNEEGIPTRSGGAIEAAFTKRFKEWM